MKCLHDVFHTVGSRLKRFCVLDPSAQYNTVQHNTDADVKKCVSSVFSAPDLVPVSDPSRRRSNYNTTGQFFATFVYNRELLFSSSLSTLFLSSFHLSIFSSHLPASSLRLYLAARLGPWRQTV